MASDESVEFARQCEPVLTGAFGPMRKLDPRTGDLCTWECPAGWRIGDPCPECGHSDLVHVGTRHCPVCELIWQATPAFRRWQERIHGGIHAFKWT